MAFLFIYFSFTDFFGDIVYSDEMYNNSNYNTPENNSELKCSVCFKVYKNLFGLKRHKQYECGVEKQFSCDICLKSFSHNFHLSRHLRNVHKCDRN